MHKEQSSSPLAAASHSQFAYEEGTEWTDDEEEQQECSNQQRQQISQSSSESEIKIAPMKSLQKFHKSSKNHPSGAAAYVEEIDEGDQVNREGLLDRLVALKYIFPWQFRNRVAKFGFFVRRTWKRVWGIAGSVSWIVTTSLILVGLPMFIEYDREQGMMAFEKEQQKAEQLI